MLDTLVLNNNKLVGQFSVLPPALTSWCVIVALSNLSHGLCSLLQDARDSNCFDCKQSSSLCTCVDRECTVPTIVGITPFPTLITTSLTLASTNPPSTAETHASPVTTNAATETGNSKPKSTTTTSENLSTTVMTSTSTASSSTTTSTQTVNTATTTLTTTATTNSTTSSAVIVQDLSIHSSAPLIGGIVGGVVGLICIMAAVAFLIIRRSRRGQPNQSSNPPPPVSPSQVSSNYDKIPANVDYSLGNLETQSASPAISPAPPQTNYEQF